jgi:hypothetical protein
MADRLAGPQRPESARRRTERRWLIAAAVALCGGAVAAGVATGDSDSPERNNSAGGANGFETTTPTTMRAISARPTTTERPAPTPPEAQPTTTTTSPPETEVPTTTTSTSATTTTLPPNQPVTGEGDIESWQPLDTPTASEVCAAGAGFDAYPGAEGQEPNDSWGHMIVTLTDPEAEAQYLFVTDGANTEDAGVLGTAALEGFVIRGSVALEVGPEGGCAAEMDQAGQFLGITVTQTAQVPAGTPVL